MFPKINKKVKPKSELTSSKHSGHPILYFQKYGLRDTIDNHSQALQKTQWYKMDQLKHPETQIVTCPIIIQK